jgi:hypothetical protein
VRGPLTIALVLFACGGDDGMQHQGATFDPEEHRGDHNLFGVDLDQWQSRAGDVIAGNPGFTGIPGIDGAAVDGLTLPTTDFFGAARDAEPDIGAVER